MKNKKHQPFKAILGNTVSQKKPKHPNIQWEPLTEEAPKTLSQVPKYVNALGKHVHRKLTNITTELSLRINTEADELEQQIFKQRDRITALEKQKPNDPRVARLQDFADDFADELEALPEQVDRNEKLFYALYTVSVVCTAGILIILLFA